MEDVDMAVSSPKEEKAPDTATEDGMIVDPPAVNQENVPEKKSPELNPHEESAKPENLLMETGYRERNDSDEEIEPEEEEDDDAHSETLDDNEIEQGQEDDHFEECDNELNLILQLENEDESENKPILSSPVDDLQGENTVREMENVFTDIVSLAADNKTIPNKIDIDQPLNKELDKNELSPKNEKEKKNNEKVQNFESTSEDNTTDEISIDVENSKSAIKEFESDLDLLLNSLASFKDDTIKEDSNQNINTEIKMDNLEPKTTVQEISEKKPSVTTAMKPTPKPVNTADIQIIDSSDDEKESTADNQKSLETKRDIEDTHTDASMTKKRKLSGESAKKEPVSKPIDVVDLDSDNETDQQEKSKTDDSINKNANPAEVSIHLPSSIEVISKANATSKISCVANENGSVISGLPASQPKNLPAMRINTAEITISTVNRNSISGETSITPVEIYNIDSDDEDKQKIDQKENIIKSEQPPITNKKESKSKPPKDGPSCINPSCESKGDLELQPCPIFVLGMLKIKRGRHNKHPEICVDCLNSVTDSTQILVEKFCNKEPLINIDSLSVKEMDTLVEELDSDSDSEETTNKRSIPYSNDFKIDEKNLEFISDHLSSVMEDLCIKYDFDNQIMQCNDVVNNGIKEIEETTRQLEKEIKELADNTIRIRYEFYNNVKIKKTFLPPLNLPYDENQMDNTSTDSRMTRLLKPVKIEGKSSRPVDPEYIKSLPPFGIFVPPPLVPGNYVYTLKQSIFGIWLPAIIVNVNPLGSAVSPGVGQSFSILTVKFYSSGRQHIKQVTGRQVAHSVSANVRYQIGMRVIALFKDASAVIKKDAYYSGVVAETPSQDNRYRYLIFFDDGYCQYVLHNNILPVVEKSPNVWDDIHMDSRDFVRKYLQNYPDRPMVRMSQGQILRTERKGTWQEARVLTVDASLALLRFEDGREEWIYRGSTRIALLYKQLQSADKRPQVPTRYRTTGPIAHSRSQNCHVPYIEYTRETTTEASKGSTVAETSSTANETKKTRAVAKKSTSTISSTKVEDLTPEIMDGNTLVKTKIVFYSPKVWIHPAQMIPHICNKMCLKNEKTKTLPLSELKTYNPLARPLLSAWERQIVKSRYRKIIMYKAPCGRRIRNMEELHRYLRLTKSEMSVDLFDFNPKVHCLAEFALTKVLVSQSDITHGVEAVPVPCVNYYDHSLPKFWVYSTKRMTTTGVNLNLDDNFLCSCDCVDDCRDKSKCQCWKLTFEGAKFFGLDCENIGYVYKRLLEQVPTGIYECNSRCKCAATCLNRVVQHPLQLKLQVFMTSDKGWGIRALNDIPKGTFICIYTGNLLTDATADIDAKTSEGDKFLADLDYIEVVERLKEGYEADVPFDDKSSENKSDSEDEAKRDKNYVIQNRSDHDESDEEFNANVNINPSMQVRRSLRSRNKPSTDQTDSKDKKKETKDGEPNNSDMITISDEEDVVREPSRFNAPEGFGNDEYVPKHLSVRTFYGNDDCFIMDARVRGNIGRYLNHSCAPNVFVQNVFVDTQDPRFPWVAFFALIHIKAGTELTWNYNYDIGSVPGKIIYCKCGAPNCRGRLL